MAVVDADEDSSDFVEERVHQVVQAVIQSLPTSQLPSQFSFVSIGRATVMSPTANGSSSSAVPVIVDCVANNCVDRVVSKDSDLHVETADEFADLEDNDSRLYLSEPLNRNSFACTPSTSSNGGSVATTTINTTTTGDG